MKLSLEWLNEFVDVSDISINKICDDITMSGSKVEDYEILADDIKNVVVGKILKIEKHPDADKLVVCTVEVSDKRQITVVTAATNVFEGALVPVAVAPAYLPGGVKIEAGKLRGVTSEGMFCSIAELNLTLNDMPDAIEDGIFILPEGLEIGSDVCDSLGLRDTVINFEITPNRPDCLSIIGLAREVAATFNRKINYHTPVYNGNKDLKISDYLKSVEIKDSDLCSRYSAGVITDVKIQPSPLWMRNRLRAMGVRPINNIVDITNYIMLEYGQPMHAFDYSCLDGQSITVRRAGKDENFITLDDNSRALSDEMLVIADSNKPVALAGVMGGKNSEISENTKTVVFEAANFNGPSVRNTSRRLGMRTESSGRFEKGIDPELTLSALYRTFELVEQLGAGKVVSDIIDVYPVKKQQIEVDFNPERINDFLGTNLSEEEMLSYLTRLELPVKDGKIIVPSFRSDINMMADVAEEIARMYGYDKIDSTVFKAEAKTGEYTYQETVRTIINNLLLFNGYYETKTFSFISPDFYNKSGIAESDNIRDSIKISNPLGEETSIMRRSLLPSALETLSINYSQGNDSAAVFETAKIYIPDDNGDHKEPYETVFAFYNNGDFYDLKGTVEEIISMFDFSKIKFTSVTDNPSFHPGRTAKLTADGKDIATLGEVHPKILKNYGIELPCYLCVLDIEYLSSLKIKDKHFTPLSRYPKVTRDFSFVCDNDLEADKISDIIKESVGELLEDVKLFDVYRGAQVGPDKKSLSYRVALRANDHTLKDEEADSVVTELLSELENKIGITLRK